MLQAQRDNRIAVGRTNELIPETVRNIRTIHTCQQENYLRQRYGRTIRASFDAMEAARKYIGSKPLRYDKIRTSFTFDGGNLTLLPGSQELALVGRRTPSQGELFAQAQAAPQRDASAGDRELVPRR